MKFLQLKDELNYTKKRKKLEREIEFFFESKEYQLIDANIFQNYNEFIHLTNRIDSKSTVKVLSGNSEIFILRPDITMNILEKLLKKWSGDTPIKVYYNSKIFKYKKDMSIGEYRQIGVEYLGEELPIADQEIISMAIKLMGKSDYECILELGTSKYIDGLFSELDIVEAEKNNLYKLIYYKNKSELKSCLSKLKIDKDIKLLFKNIFDLQGDIDTVIKLSKKYYTNNIMEQSINELMSLRDFFYENDLNKYIHFDLSMIPDLDYYDGIIFKGYSSKSYKKILSGGRYDSLTKEFGEKISAIGFSVDIDEMMKIILMEEK